MPSQTCRRGSTPSVNGHVRSRRGLTPSSRKGLDLCDLDVFAPRLDVLDEQCLQHLRIAGEWVAAQISQERLRLLVDSNLIKQRFELVEDWLRRALWHVHGPP